MKTGRRLATDPAERAETEQIAHSCDGSEVTVTVTLARPAPSPAAPSAPLNTPHVVLKRADTRSGGGPTPPAASRFDAGGERQHGIMDHTGDQFASPSELYAPGVV
ncbi:hypothetical protein [Streptomyces mayteni]